MPLSVSFTTSQVVGAPQNIVLVDSTTGSDVTATARQIFLQTATGQWLTEDGLTDTQTAISWPIADGLTITLDVLENDMALDITLRYITSGGATVAEDIALRGFTLYNETFYYSLTQSQASQNQPPPMIIQDSNYYMNKATLRTEIDSGNQAIELGDDITSAQNCYDRATYMVTNQNDYF
jgi:hypothetical protein